MSKLKNALFGLSASGSISGGLTYLRRMRQQIVEKTPVVKDAKSMPQLSWRHMFLKVVALWHALSAAEKLEWESAARPKHMTGYAWFVSQALRPNPGIYLPLQGGKMQGEIDMDGFRIEDLPDPTLPQDAATKEYVDLALASMVWNYFLNDTPSGIGSYDTMSQTATGDPESDFPTAGLSGGDAQALTEWITDEAVPYLIIRKGQLDFHIHAQKTVGNRSVIIYAELYEYKTDTSEVLIATTEDSSAITDKVSVSLHATLADDYTLSTGSKLLVKYLADLGAGAPTTIVLSAEGSTAAGIDVSVLSSAFDDVYIRNSILVAQSILAAVSDATPIAVEVAEQRLVGRITGGNITGLTIAQILTLIGVAAGADVTGDNPPKAHEGTHVSGGSDDIDSALANAAIPNLPTSKITSGQFPLVRMPRAANALVLTAKGPGVSPAYEAAGAATFIELTDTPGNFTDDSLKVVRVNVGETALEFVAFVAGGGARCIVTQFQSRAATGTFNNPQYLNDGLTTPVSYGEGVGIYIEVLFDAPLYVTQYRQFGDTSNVGDGRYKLQRLVPSTDTWVDWITGIATRTTADWSTWVSNSKALASGIKLIMTTEDTGAPTGHRVRLAELEVKY